MVQRVACGGTVTFIHNFSLEDARVMIGLETPRDVETGMTQTQIDAASLIINKTDAESCGQNTHRVELDYYYLTSYYIIIFYF